MANVLGELFGNIANAIREKTGDTTTMKPAEFPSKIGQIPVGGSPDIVLLSKQDITDFTMDSTFETFARHYAPASFALEVGKEYRVLWDNEEHICTACSSSAPGYPVVYIGNALQIGGESAGENFLIVYTPAANHLTLFAVDDKTSHNVAVYEVAETTSADLCYVTFMNEDGTVELGKKAVATGDDCADPIARGVFDTPTRESTAQYNYTFAGWATEANGGLDSNALKEVTENRTVYANYISAVRYYTITYYDSDGTTVLKTESLAYGSTPSYVPVKTGYTFTGWNTAIETVTGDAEYIAQWIEKLDFSTLSWSKIAEYAESGEAANVFEIGATKTFETQAGVSVVAEIIGFNHDDLADGTGKAGITLKMNNSFDNQRPSTGGVSSWGSAINTTTYLQLSWDTCETRKYWNMTTSGMALNGILPSDLVNVIKQVKKKYYDIPNAAIETTDDYLWLPSLSELGFTDYGDHGECYAAYTQNKVASTDYAELIEYNDGSAVMYGTRSKASASLNQPCISMRGSYTTSTQGSGGIYTFPHFCI